MFNFTEVTKRWNGLVVTAVMLDVEIREKQGSLLNLPVVCYLVSDQTMNVLVQEPCDGEGHT